MSIPQQASSSVIPIWTTEQRLIIEAPPLARLLVIAGPGTGKTAVACARVAWLANLGINPSSILMFSFTRAAVAELRSRILLWSGNPAVTSVRISTLDSQAWHFRYGTGTDFENLGGSFDENIEETIKLIEEGNDVLDEYLEATGKKRGVAPFSAQNTGSGMFSQLAVGTTHWMCRRESRIERPTHQGERQT